MSVNCPSPHIQHHPVIPSASSMHSRRSNTLNQQFHLSQDRDSSSSLQPSEDAQKSLHHSGTSSPRYSKPFTPARSVTPSPRQLEYSRDAPKHPNTPADTAHDLSPPRSPVNNQDNVIANDYSSLLPPSRDINYHYTTSAGTFTSSTRTLIVSTGTTLHE